MARTAVIIPFFQRRRGILQRAIESIIDQAQDGHIQIIVIDDESPIDPQNEIPHSLPSHISISILKQKNAGPGAARNAGLDSISSQTDFVAFIDSDDQWARDHLQSAIDALGDELDFYFSNYREPDSSVDEFSRKQILQISEHQLLARGANCYRYDGDMVDQIIRGNVIETSTVVYRWRTLDQIRFRQGHRYAFEDHLFWLDAVKRSRGIAFSLNVEANYGRGISIWRSTGLGSEFSFRQMIDQLKYAKLVSQCYVATSEQKIALQRLRDEARRSFVAEILHRLRRRIAIDCRELWQIIRLDPIILLSSPFQILAIFFKKMRLR